MSLFNQNNLESFDLSVSQILLKAGFKRTDTSRDTSIYEIWSYKDNRNIRIACDDRLEVWYDQHSKKGGTVLEFIMYWWNLTEAAALIKLKFLKQDLLKHKRPRKKLAIKVPHYILEDVKDLGNNDYVSYYLFRNGILELAMPLFKEIYYYTTDFKGLRKNFCAAACQNAQFGWQVISKNFNGCIGKEGITLIKNDLQRVAVFENQFRYLCWKKEHDKDVHSALILNSAGGLHEAITAAMAFPEIDLHFSSSHAGHVAAKKFVDALPYAANRSIN